MTTSPTLALSRAPLPHRPPPRRARLSTSTVHRTKVSPQQKLIRCVAALERSRFDFYFLAGAETDCTAAASAAARASAMTPNFTLGEWPPFAVPSRV